MSLSLFLSHRLTLLHDQLQELGSLCSLPLSPLGRECLALRQQYLAEELVQLSTIAENEGSSATAHNTREAAA